VQRQEITLCLGLSFQICLTYIDIYMYLIKTMSTHFIIYSCLFQAYLISFTISGSFLLLWMTIWGTGTVYTVVELKHGTLVYTQEKRNGVIMYHRTHSSYIYIYISMTGQWHEPLPNHAVTLVILNKWPAVWIMNQHCW